MRRIAPTLAALRDLHRFFTRHPLAREAPVSAWRRFAVWQLRSRMADEVDVPWIGGLRLSVRRGMTGATGNLYVGLHEFHDMGFVLHFLRPGDLFVDAGANVGSFSMLASGLAGARSAAFEPDPDTAAAFRRNIALNGLGDLVEVHQVALGPEPGNVSFTRGFDTVNRVVPSHEAGTRVIRQERLDDLLGGRSPRLIKLDVEGYEEQVLRGATATLADPQLMAIESETVSDWARARLSEAGFEPASYDPLTRALKLGGDAKRGSNELFIRGRDLVTDRIRGAAPVEVLGRRF